MSHRRIAPTLPLILAGVLATACSSPKPGPIDGKKARGHVQRLVALAPRPAGSENLAKAADYIAGQIQGMGLEPKRHEFAWTGPALKGLEPGTLPDPITIRNVWTAIPAKGGKDAPWVAFGAHYDSKLTAGHATTAHNFKFTGAIDGGGAPGVLLELMRAVKDRPDNKVNWMFVFFDGEESLPWDWDDSQSLIGSTRFVADFSKTNEHFPDTPLIDPGKNAANHRLKALILLDLIGSRDIKIDRDLSSKPEALNDLFTEAAESLPGEQAERVFLEKGDTKDDHIPFRDANVDTCLLIDFQHRIAPGLGGIPSARNYGKYTHWWHTSADNINAVAPKALELAGNLVWFALPLLEARYGK